MENRIIWGKCWNNRLKPRRGEGKGLKEGGRGRQSAQGEEYGGNLCELFDSQHALLPTI